MKKISILSLDGGGIRGIISCIILRYIEEQLKNLHHPQAKVGDYFDMIAGSSTGGLITAVLLYPDENRNSKYSIQKGLELYSEKGNDIERLEYELAIIDGKLYTKKGKLFDTAFGGTGRKPIGKAIFVMSEDGRIFSSNNYPRGIFHHSSFFAGGEVAAGELKVTKGVIEFVSKQSGHYQPTSKYFDTIYERIGKK